MYIIYRPHDEKPQRLPFWKRMKAGATLTACFRPRLRKKKSASSLGPDGQPKIKTGFIMKLCSWRLKRNKKVLKQAAEAKKEATEAKAESKEAEQAKSSPPPKEKAPPKKICPNFGNCCGKMSCKGCWPKMSCKGCCPNFSMKKTCSNIFCSKCCGNCCTAMGNGCRSFWRTIFCLNSTCCVGICSRCKKERKTSIKEQQQPPDKPMEKRGSEKRGSFAERCWKWMGDKSRNLLILLGLRDPDPTDTGPTDENPTQTESEPQKKSRFKLFRRSVLAPKAETDTETEAPKKRWKVFKGRNLSAPVDPAPDSESADAAKDEGKSNKWKSFKGRNLQVPPSTADTSASEAESVAPKKKWKAFKGRGLSGKTEASEQSEATEGQGTSDKGTLFKGLGTPKSESSAGSGGLSAMKKKFKKKSEKFKLVNTMKRRPPGSKQKEKDEGGNADETA